MALAIAASYSGRLVPPPKYGPRPPLPGPVGFGGVDFFAGGLAGFFIDVFVAIMGSCG